MTGFSPHPDRRPSVVTGASSGIGAAAARHLGLSGFPVVLGARRVERCEAVAAEIRAGGGEAHAVALDLAAEGSPADFVKQAEALVGPIDVAVLAGGQSLPDSHPGAFETLVEVNLVGTHRLVTALLPGMKQRRRGDLIVVGSEVVRHPRPGTAGYVATKWGQEGFTRALQMELEGTGVRATIVQSGQAATEMGTGWDAAATSAILEDWIRWGLARHGNFLTPEAVTAAIMHAVTTPRGTHLTLIEVQPEAPVKPHDS